MSRANSAGWDRKGECDVPIRATSSAGSAKSSWAATGSALSRSQMTYVLGIVRHAVSVSGWRIEA
jgi:hypothetical protein